MFGKLLGRNRGNRKVLIWLYKKHKGKCFYCGCNTVLPAHHSQNKGFDKMATIEHVYSKNDLRRLLIPQFSKIKLSCYKCNNSKGLEDRNKAMANYNYAERHDGLLINLLKKYTK